MDSIFCGTFNANGRHLSAEDVSTWLGQGASSADLVILSLQEYPTSSHEGNSLNELKKYNRCSKKRLGSGNLPKGNESLTHLVEGALSTCHEMLADISMGETPTFGMIEVCNKQIEWYGFIRLLVYSKIGPIEDLKCSTITIYCPVGTKPSAHVNEPSYDHMQSPDKGSVCLAIPALKLLVCSAHLVGTNKYNVPERDFDRLRIEQFQKISSKCVETMGHEQFSQLRPIILGDLNFRCEVYSNPEEKSKGGKDFSAVNDLLQSSDANQIRELFRKYDRLNMLLRKEREFEGIILPPILKDVVDVFWEEFIEKEKIDNETNMLLPTFTFNVGEKTYSNKRTPSWTDRVLVSKRILKSENATLSFVNAHYNVTLSDHVPVTCLIHLQDSIIPH